MHSSSANLTGLLHAATCSSGLSGVGAENGTCVLELRIQLDGSREGEGTLVEVPVIPSVEGNVS